MKLSMNHSYSILVRALLVAPIAMLVTGLLLALMQSLIAHQAVDTPEVKDYAAPDIVMPEVKITTVHEVIKPVLDEPKEIPRIEPIIEPQWQTNDGNNIQLTSYQPPPITPGTHASIDREPIAKLMSAPDYPRSAAYKGIEGYVDITFDVTIYGTTENVRVLASKPERVFDKSAIASIKRWKFTPFIVDGKEAPYTGMTRRVIFQLEN